MKYHEHQILWHIVAPLHLVLHANGALGVQVQPGDFSSAAIIEDYNDIQLRGSPSAPFVVDTDTYNTENGLARIIDGAVIGRDGFALATQSGLGWMDIHLGQPVFRAGMYVGVDAAWTADLSFYDTHDALLTTLSLDGEAGQTIFAGWQTEGNFIARIRLTDTAKNGRITVFDDFIIEVPEPSSAGMLITSLLAMCAIQRRRRALHH